MGKLYTLDGKLLTETPEIRIGEKVYAVDNRKKTVTKIKDIIKNEGTDIEQIDRVIQEVLGKAAAKEIEAAELPFPAYQRMFELLMAAVTGEDVEEVSARFQKPESSTSE